MKRSRTYQTTLRAAAFLLLIGVVMPSGLHAKSLVDYCLSPPATDEPVEKDHSCCASDASQQSDSGVAHDCEWEALCVCHIEPAPLTDQNWTAPKPDLKAVELPVRPVSVSDTESTHSVLPLPDTPRAGPPLWLMNAAFLN